MKTVEWTKIIEKTYNGECAICPECGGTVMSQLYTRKNDASKMGFAILKCHDCKTEMNFSRIKFPDNVITKEF